jgi:preprotein translocase subunit YajC
VKNFTGLEYLALSQVVAVSWFQFYVKFSELLFWVQDGAAPAAAEAGSSMEAGPATGAAPAAGEAGKALAEAPNPIVQFAPILIIGFFFYFILLRPQQKEQRRRQDFLSNLKKNAKVVTTGGLIGTVADISSDGRFVTLKVDDSTRMRFLRSAIQGELEDKPDTTGTAAGS